MSVPLQRQSSAFPSVPQPAGNPPPPSSKQGPASKAPWAAPALFTERLEDALAESISGKPFSDTAFHVFSARLASGKVGKPRTVLANGGMLRSSSAYFRARESFIVICKLANVHSDCPQVLAGGFAEHIRSVDPASLDSTTTNYDYESDSDLEDSQEDEDEDDIEETPSSSVNDTVNDTATTKRDINGPKVSLFTFCTFSGTEHHGAKEITKFPPLTKVVPLRSVAAVT